MKHIKITQNILPTIVLLLVFTTFAYAQSTSSNFLFPELPYQQDALEPYIDAQTVGLHYNKHHRGYYKKFTTAIKGTALETESIEQIFAHANNLSTFVRNNAGGYYNHILYWENMAPASQEIPSKLEKELTKSFGSVEGFKSKFNKVAASVFGSGWAWLVHLPNGELAITSTSNQDNPLMNDVEVQGKPLLALDVWEHAYYLNYQNKRSDYIEAFWNVVNWDVVAKRYKQ